MCTHKTGISSRTGIREIPSGRDIPDNQEIPESREIPGREKFEGIRPGGNGNFLLNIPGVWVVVGVWQGVCLMADNLLVNNNNKQPKLMARLNTRLLK